MATANKRLLSKCEQTSSVFVSKVSSFMGATIDRNVHNVKPPAIRRRNGVRPSRAQRVKVQDDASKGSDIAAPEDGRTPTVEAQSEFEPLDRFRI